MKNKLSDQRPESRYAYESAFYNSSAGHGHGPDVGTWAYYDAGDRINMPEVKRMAREREKQDELKAERKQAAEEAQAATKTPPADEAKSAAAGHAPHAGADSNSESDLTPPRRRKGEVSPDHEIEEVGEDVEEEEEPVYKSGIQQWYDEQQAKEAAARAAKATAAAAKDASVDAARAARAKAADAKDAAARNAHNFKRLSV